MCAIIHITTETGYRVRKEGGGENHPKNLKIITSSGETWGRLELEEWTARSREKKIRERTQGGSSNTEGNLRDHNKIYYCRCILKYMLQVESPKSGGENVPTRHLLPANETFSNRNGLCVIEILAKRDNIEISEQCRLLPQQLSSFFELMVRPYCWREYNICLL